MRKRSTGRRGPYGHLHESMDRPHGPDLLDQAFTRAAGASLVAGNSVRLLRDGAGNYPQWLRAIGGAQQHICFENFIFYEDEVGAEFAAALIERARAGVEVRLIYDWLGCFGKASKHFWRPLIDAGVRVRCFNPPRTVHPIRWLQRDHRKLLAVDGADRIHHRPVCGQALARRCRAWHCALARYRRGDPRSRPERNRECVCGSVGPQRTGGGRDRHAAPDAFAPFVPPPRPVAAAGNVSLRVVATAPGTLAVLRLDQLIAAAARRTLWLTDAYFAGIPPYIQALRAAALDGVDVRLLVPGASDISILRPLSQAGYRPLLEGGVRVFEWKGSMLHAKTAVADGRWARVGSSNLNIASWVGNYELDALIEDEGFATQMEQMFEADIALSTEIVLRRERAPPAPTPSSREEERCGDEPGGSPRGAAAGPVAPRPARCDSDARSARR